MNPAAQNPPMSQEIRIETLRDEWEDHLTERGHKVRVAKGIGDGLESRDASGNRFRWLFLAAKAKTKAVNEYERADIEHHLRRAQALNQKVYLVVGFEKPKPKLVVLPGEAVLRKGTIASSKGGIPWKH